MSTSNRISTMAKNKDNSITTLDNFVKVMGPTISVITIVVGVLQFQSQQTYTEEQEFKRQLWNKKLGAYNEISELVSSIVSSINRKNKHKFDSLSLKYDEIYLKNVPLFDYDSVDYRMEKFNRELYDLRKGEGDTASFQRKGFRLIKVCMESLKQSKNEITDNAKAFKSN